MNAKKEAEKEKLRNETVYDRIRQLHERQNMQQNIIKIHNERINQLNR
jgi:hypothetical protein